VKEKDIVAGRDTFHNQEKCSL